MLPLVPSRVQFVHVIFVAFSPVRQMDAESLWNGVFGRVTLSSGVVARLLRTVLCWNPTEKIRCINKKKQHITEEQLQRQIKM